MSLISQSKKAEEVDWTVKPVAEVCLIFYSVKKTEIDAAM